MRAGICYNVEYRPDVHGSASYYIGSILEQVDLLEELGYDTVWFSEHHCAGYSFGGPAVIAAAAAQRTRRIRIGSGVSLLPLHHPIILAEQYGLLDVLSGGRLDYGIGRGTHQTEYDWMGVPMSESHSRYRETAELIIKAWTENEPFSFHGRHYHLDGYAAFPKPVQRPHPPIYAAAGGTRGSFEWAAVHGLHLATALFTGVGRARDNITLYRDELRAHGVGSREVCVITQMHCAGDRAEAIGEGAKYVNRHYRFLAEVNASNPGAAAFFGSADGKALNGIDAILLGDPEDLRARITALRGSLGMDLLLMEVAQGGMPQKDVLRSLELFGTQVLPQIRPPGAPPSESRSDFSSNKQGEQETLFAARRG